MGLRYPLDLWSAYRNAGCGNRQGEEIALTRRCSNIECLRKGGITGYKNVQLTTKVRCEMDFQTFPFDKHGCNLEVSSTIQYTS